MEIIMTQGQLTVSKQIPDTASDQEVLDTVEEIRTRMSVAVQANRWVNQPPPKAVHVRAVKP